MSFNLGELVAYLKVDGKKLTTGLSDAAQQVDDWGKQIPDGLKVAGAAAGAALVAGVVGAVSAEAGSDKLAAQLALDPAEQQRAGELAGRLYADAYGGSLAEVNTAIGAVISSLPGFRDASDEALQAASTNALDFAAAFDIDVQRAVASAGIVMTSGLAGSASEAFDLITAASQQVPAHLREDVLDASDEYSQFFSQLGMDGPAAFGVLVAGAEDGMYGIDKAGDAIKEFTIRSTDMSTASVAAYDAIGVDAEAMAAKILAGGDTAAEGFQQVVDGLLGIEDPTARANAAIALFGTPLEDLSTGEIPQFLESLSTTSSSMGDVSGAADRMGETLNSNASVGLETFKRGVTTAFVDIIGGRALPLLDGLVGRLGGDLPTVVVGITTAVGAFAAIWAVVTAATATYTAVMAVWRAATVVGTGVQWALNAAMSANPIGIIIVLIAALVAAIIYLWNNNDAFREALIKAWDAIKGAVTAVVDWFRTAVPAAWDWVKSKTTSAWQAVTSAVTGAWDRVKSFVTTSIERVKSLVSNGFQAVLQFIMRYHPLGIIVSNWGSIVDYVRGAVQRIRDRVSDGFQAVVTAVRNRVSDVVTTARELPGKIWDAIGNLAARAREVGGDIISGIVRGITNGVGRIKDAAKDAAGAALDAAKDFLGIRSPSRVMRDQVGAMIGAGVADGILSTQALIGSAFETSVGGLTAPVVGVTSSATAAGASGTTTSLDDDSPRPVDLSPESLRRLAWALGDVMERRPTVLDGERVSRHTTEGVVAAVAGGGR